MEPTNPEGLLLHIKEQMMEYYVVTSIDRYPILVEHRVRVVLAVGAVEGAGWAGHRERLPRLHPEVVQSALDPPHLRRNAAPAPAPGHRPPLQGSAR